MIDTGLSGKVACITGGNNPHGIGAATARALAAQGASVFVHYFRRRKEQPAGEVPASAGEELYWHGQGLDPEPLLDEIRSNEVRAAAWEADLGTPSAAHELIDHVEQMLGPIDVLVNNAAWSEPDTFKPSISVESGRATNTFPMCTLTAETHDRHFAVNSRAPALLMAEFARRHIANGRTWGES
jgi:3-oxoacyl-[acyl-carrier protein] reductase